jgi:hypothetical protein
LTVTLPGKPRMPTFLRGADSHKGTTLTSTSTLPAKTIVQTEIQPGKLLVEQFVGPSSTSQSSNGLSFFLEEYNRLTSRSQCSDLHRENYHSFHVDNNKNSGTHHLYIYGNRNSTGQHHNFVQQLRSAGINGSRSHDNYLELCHHNH